MAILQQPTQDTRQDRKVKKEKKGCVSVLVRPCKYDARVTSNFVYIGETASFLNCFRCFRYSGFSANRKAVVDV